MKQAIIVSHLEKQYRSRTNNNIFTGLLRPNWRYKMAVTDVSFAISSGESVAFLGPNGAGKTTTTKMLTGLIKPSDGTARVLGYEPFDRDHTYLKSIGLVMGNKSGLNWDLTAAQSFELLQKIYDIDKDVHRQRIVELTELLSVTHVLHKQVRKLSLGERMKLELIASLLHDPHILFLDEPTIGLDIQSKQNIRTFLRHIHEQGKTIVLTSHDMDDVEEVCDRVIVINRGVIIHDGSMRELHRQYSRNKFVTLEFVGNIPTADQLQRVGEIVSDAHGTITLAIPQEVVMTRLTELSKTYTIKDISIESVPLEVIVNDLFHKE